MLQAAITGLHGIVESNQPCTMPSAAASQPAQKLYQHVGGSGSGAGSRVLTAPAGQHNNRQHGFCIAQGIPTLLFCIFSTFLQNRAVHLCKQSCVQSHQVMHSVFSQHSRHHAPAGSALMRLPQSVCMPATHNNTASERTCEQAPC